MYLRSTLLNVIILENTFMGLEYVKNSFPIPRVKEKISCIIKQFLGVLEVRMCDNFKICLRF